MTEFIAITVAVVAAAVYGYRYYRRRGTRPIVAAARGGHMHRFSGKGIAPPPGPPRRRTLLAAGEQRTVRRNSRISGHAYIPPNAVGLACGKPVASCTRGGDCLCVH